SLKILHLLTKPRNQLLETLLNALLFCYDLVLHFLYLVLIFLCIDALKLEFCFRTLNPYSDIGRFNRTYTMHLLYVASLCIKCCGEAIGCQLHNVTRSDLGYECSSDREL